MNENKSTFDMVILGSGSAAFAAAIKASEKGAKVVMAERREVGGTCVNRGCVPSKTLIRAAEVYRHAGRHPFRGLRTRQEGLDFAELAGQKDDLVHALRQKKYLDIADAAQGISIIEGNARLLGERAIQVDGQRIEAGKTLIATGARPFIPDVPGLNEVPYLTSDLLSTEPEFDLKELPKSLVIIGGGVIACELGQMFQGLGTPVTILQKAPRLLTGMDEEVSETLCKILNDEGVQTFCDAEVKEVGEDGDGVWVSAAVEGETRKIKAHRLLVAAGVVPNTDGLGLEDLGVEKDPRGFIRVDDRMRTTRLSVWAAGDVTGPPLATPVGAREGVVAAENMLDPNSASRMDYRVIPRAVFTDPEVAAVGLTAQQAKEQGFEVDARCLFLDAVPKAACIRDTRGLVKMVIEKDTRKILGVHLVAHRGADIIHEAALAIRCGLTTRDLIDMIHVYPTMSEAIRMAAQTFEKDVSKLSCCAE